MDDAKGERKVKLAMHAVAAHFFFVGQFFGFSGSFGPSKETYENVSSAILPYWGTYIPEAP